MGHLVNDALPNVAIVHLKPIVVPVLMEITFKDKHAKHAMLDVRTVLLM